MKNGKGPHAVAMAVRHYIAVLETARDHCYEDHSFFDNDISMYKAYLRVLEQDKWPENQT